MDRDRYLEIAVTYAENANYLICFQDKTYIELFFLVLKTVLKNEVIFLQRIILILKTIFRENIFMFVAKRIE